MWNVGSTGSHGSVCTFSQADLERGLLGALTSLRRKRPNPEQRTEKSTYTISPYSSTVRSIDGDGWRRPCKAPATILLISNPLSPNFFTPACIFQSGVKEMKSACNRISLQGWLCTQAIDLKSIFFIHIISEWKGWFHNLYCKIRPEWKDELSSGVYTPITPKPQGITPFRLSNHLLVNDLLL